MLQVSSYTGQNPQDYQESETTYLSFQLNYLGAFTLYFVI